MEPNIFEVIQKLSNERQHLFELGGVQNLSAEQRKRIDEISGRLPGLWEDYRRELATPVASTAHLSKREKMQRAMVGQWEHGEEDARSLRRMNPAFLADIDEKSLNPASSRRPGAQPK